MRRVENPALRRSASRSRSCSKASGGGVELAAVEFDDEVVCSSVDGVDFVAGDGWLNSGSGQVVAFEEADEVVFEVERVAPRSGVSCELSAGLDIG